MITTNIIEKQGAEAMEQHLKLLDQRILEATAQGLQAGLLLVAGIAQREFLSGPRPARLGVVSGRLAGSLSPEVQVSANSVTGRITSSAPYAAFHEFGFHGTEQVRAYDRATHVFNARGRQIEPRRAYRDTKGQRQGWKETKLHAAQRRSRTATIGHVRAHQRRVNYDGRPFLMPAMEKGAPMVMEEIKKRIGEAQTR